MTRHSSARATINIDTFVCRPDGLPAGLFSLMVRIIFCLCVVYIQIDYVSLNLLVVNAFCCSPSRKLLSAICAVERLFASINKNRITTVTTINQAVCK